MSSESPAQGNRPKVCIQSRTLKRHREAIELDVVLGRSCLQFVVDKQVAVWIRTGGVVWVAAVHGVDGDGCAIRKRRYVARRVQTVQEERLVR
jgi:hypothetical protein